MRLSVCRTLYHTQRHFDASVADDFLNIVKKGVIAHNEQYLHLQQCFQVYFLNLRDFQ